MQNFKYHFRFFGKRCRDRVTGFEGVGSSVCFDLYGCIQTALQPRAIKDQTEQPKGQWFDNNRLETIEETPVMDLPEFLSAPVARDTPGGYEKSVP